MTDSFDVVVVGAGLGGLQMLHQVREAGLTVRVFEAGGGAGGTWYWNRYPGARCDVESLEYSYQFSEELQKDWEWTRRYASQPEILRYVGHVVERFDLDRDIQYDTRVVALTYDEPACRWTVRTEAGEEAVARFVVLATGCLSSVNLPDIPGRETFSGEILHTARWPHEPVELSGRRVGVVGTGSSGVQLIPAIAEEAKELHVFQRTAAYTLPARDQPLDPGLQAAVKADYAGFRARNNAMATAGLSRYPTNPSSVFLVSAAEREAAFEYFWGLGGPLLLRSFGDLMADAAANELVADFIRGKIRQIVQDPDVAELLSPKQPVGCKRVCVGTGYYETFNRPNVHLVDVASAPIEEITPDALRTAAGTHGLDVIVFATGFDAMTGALLGIDIRGRDGLPLKEMWAAGPRTYLGLGVPGFPNLFTMTGPGSPSVLTNMLVAIHQHATWIGDCLKYLADNDISAIEATREAEEAWGLRVNEVAGRTLFSSCDSWYLGANIPGKKRVFMPFVGFPAYARTCAEVAAGGYQGFALTRLGA
ncbi:NAD(P)/FAD-dependent oxidoreductase [Streptomyces sp. NPDC052109]|uniref:flavin-containing monooxygenase n=1 Tax=Streptomyces sp. NPDC052109 TaxID=3155527 RepID=UPI00341EE06E